MIPALTALMTSVTLSVVLAIAAKGKHRVTSSGHSFRIAGFFRWFIYGFFPVVTFGSVYAVRTLIPTPWPESRLDWIVVGLFGYFVLTMGAMCVYAKTYCIEVDAQSIRMRQFWSERVLPVEEIGRVALYRGAKAEYLRIYNRSGKLVFNIASTIQDFSGLVRLLGQHCSVDGV